MTGKMKSKKSQMKIQEMSFMIIALAVFFIIILLFYLAVSLQGLRRNVAESERVGGILLAETLAGTPEFACAEHTSSVCVDADKLLALSSHPKYATFWDVTGLYVEKIYPAPESRRICTLSSYPNCNVFVLVNQTSPKGTISDASYVMLCRREFKNTYPYIQCDMGKIIVTTEKIA